MGGAEELDLSLDLRWTFLSLGSAETCGPTVGGTATWPDHRGRGQLQRWSAAAGVSGEGSAQEEQDTGAR